MADLAFAKKKSLADALSLSGEFAFAKENWKTAEKHFTAALDSCIDVVDKADRNLLGLGRLNAKRSTIRLRQNKFMEVKKSFFLKFLLMLAKLHLLQALDDAHSAIRAEPLEASGYLREAEACAYLQAYQRSSNACTSFTISYRLFRAEAYSSFTFSR